MKTKDKVKKLDAGLRHKSGLNCQDFVEHYTKVFREHAYATHDDSWNEFEKEITHVLGMLIYHKRFLELIGFYDQFKDEYGDGADIRDFINKWEDGEEIDLKIEPKKFR